MTKEEIINRIKARKNNITTSNSHKEIKPNKFIRNGIYKLLISAVIFLVTLITIKYNPDIKNILKKNIYENNMSFMVINDLYKKYLGDIIPFETPLDNPPITQVFNEKIEYKNASLYKDGVSLEVSNEYLVPIIESGLVVFIGAKEGYGNTIIVQGIDGVDIWYSDITNSNVALYDYVTKGKPLGQTVSNKLNLVFNKEGKFLDYNEFIN